MIEVNSEIQCHLLELTPRVGHEMKNQQFLMTNNLRQGILYRLNFVSTQNSYIKS